MEHETIISRFLTPKASAFVKSVEREFMRYAWNPSKDAISGCLKRDRVRYLLTSRAYKRYAATI